MVQQKTLLLLLLLLITKGHCGARYCCHASY
jgi:hypothetical protein